MIEYKEEYCLTCDDDIDKLRVLYINTFLLDFALEQAIYGLDYSLGISQAENNAEPRDMRNDALQMMKILLSDKYECRNLFKFGGKNNLLQYLSRDSINEVLRAHNCASIEEYFEKKFTPNTSRPHMKSYTPLGKKTI